MSEVKWQLIDLFDQTYADLPSEKNTDHPHKEDLEYSVKNKSVVQISTRRSLARIKTISKKHGARFMLFLIPAHPELRSENNSIEHNLQVFEGFNPFIPSFLTGHDYMDLPNDHLNNSGHQKYAEFILRALESIPSFKGQKDV